MEVWRKNGLPMSLHTFCNFATENNGQSLVFRCLLGAGRCHVGLGPQLGPGLHLLLQRLGPRGFRSLGLLPGELPLQFRRALCGGRFLRRLFFGGGLFGGGFLRSGLLCGRLLGGGFIGRPLRGQFLSLLFGSMFFCGDLRGLLLCGLLLCRFFRGNLRGAGLRRSDRLGFRHRRRLWHRGGSRLRYRYRFGHGLRCRRRWHTAAQLRLHGGTPGLGHIDMIAPEQSQQYRAIERNSQHQRPG